MLKQSFPIKQFKLVNLLLLVIFFMLWLWFLFNLKLLYDANGAQSSLVYAKLRYLAYFLILDMLLLAVSMSVWSIDTKKKIRKMSIVKTEKERIIKSQQIKYEEQAKLLSDMTELYNKALEYDKVKTDFFSNISHELKTPLSVILGSIQLMDKSYDIDPIANQKHYRVIRQNCFRLIRLINNILDLSRLDSGFMKINPVNCNIVYLIEEITQSVANYAAQKGIKIEFDTEYEEIITSVDVDKIERIMLNLLSNSIKFTKSGGSINVYIFRLEDDIFISVKDTGIGIPPDMQKSIFDRFKQVGNDLVRDYEGSGIGLSIVKSFIEMHNGTITVKSEMNKGSEFVITLPVKLVSASTVNELENNKLHSKIIESIKIELSDIYSVAS